MKKVQLVLLISNPNQSFVKTEIETFAKLTTSLYVLSTTHDVPDYALPSNVVFQKITSLNYKKNRVSLLLISVFVHDLFLHITNVPYVKKSRKHLSFLRQADCLKTSLTSFLKANKLDEKTPVLSFWCDIWAVSLSLFKKKHSTYKTYSRLHGRDLYEERMPTTTFAIPFRHFVIKELDALLPISKHGSEYLKSKYPQFKHKITCNYLGCIDLNVIPETSDVFTILSIATIRHVKRIHRIAEVVRDYPEDVHWIHIGGEADSSNDSTIGYTQQLVGQIKQQANKKVVMTGQISPEKIAQVVHEYRPHVFLNTSEFEGLPVSVMEALSMGIPCIATDVGGTKELVNESFLLQPDFSNEDLIKQLLHLSKNYNAQWKTNARQIWEEKLNPIQLRKALLNNIK